MWLEIKAGFTVASTIINSLIFAWITVVTGNVIFLMLGFVPIIIQIGGDLLIGWKVVNSDAVNWLEPNGLGERSIILHLIGGGVRTLKGTKDARGKINFVYAKKKASVIDDGRYPIRLPSGNSGVVAHESYDRNIDYYKAELLRELFVEHKVDNVKDLYKALIVAEEKNEQV